jgi:hypothetical protein
MTLAGQRQTVALRASHSAPHVILFKIKKLIYSFLITDGYGCERSGSDS